MNQSFKEALENRRSCYDLNKLSPSTDDKIEEIIDFALLNVPSAFNSQSTRIVLLLGDQHQQLWDIVLEVLSAMIPKEKFAATEEKINTFSKGYGTVLFFEDYTVIKKLQTSYPTYAQEFPVWSHHTSAMHQLTVWTMLEAEGFGASLQHYGNLIDHKVHETWSLDPEWVLVAQLPFGGMAGEKPHRPEKLALDITKRVFK